MILIYSLVFFCILTLTIDYKKKTDYTLPYAPPTKIPKKNLHFVTTLTVLVRTLVRQQDYRAPLSELMQPYT
jgi:hypothetical protein